MAEAQRNEGPIDRIVGRMERSLTCERWPNCKSWPEMHRT